MTHLCMNRCARLQGNRLCLAVPGGETPPRGVLLGKSTGGGIQYVEPAAAVSLNNELAAARGEAFAAEEAVLWRLTGLVMDVTDSLQHILNVVWLHLVPWHKLAMARLKNVLVCFVGSKSDAQLVLPMLHALDVVQHIMLHEQRQSFATASPSGNDSLIPDPRAILGI